jgi:histidinol-phosphate aminotransferase
MAISRRGFLGTVTTGVAATIAFPELIFAGEPQRAHPTGGNIILDSNENAYGAPESARKAMHEALVVSNRYPHDGMYQGLIDRIAKLHKVASEQVVLGCGSGELLRNCVTAFCPPRSHVITPSPTFESLGRHAEAAGMKVSRVPLAKDFSHDLGAMLAAVTSDTSLIYICNPNNPTGSITPRKDIEAFLAKLPERVTVVLDEAYHHFADSADYVSFLDKPVARDRLVLLRTFSKIFGMAGLRIGYSVANKATTDQLFHSGFLDNVNCVAAVSATAAMDDAVFLAPAIQRNKKDREEFIRQVGARKLNFIPSQTNFVMVDSKRPVREVIKHFRDNSIRVGRPFPPYDTHVRISLGLPEEMTEFWRVWDKMPTRS